MSAGLTIEEWADLLAHASEIGDVLWKSASSYASFIGRTEGAEAADHHRKIRMADGFHRFHVEIMDRLKKIAPAIPEDMQQAAWTRAHEYVAEAEE